MSYTTAQALKERQQLSRSYRANKKAQFKAAFEDEPRLKEFDEQIRGCGISGALTMIAICRSHHHDWLRNADRETRALALEIISSRIIQIRIHQGLTAFNDALPWEPDDVYQLCRKILTT